VVATTKLVAVTSTRTIDSCNRLWAVRVVFSPYVPTAGPAKTGKTEKLMRIGCQSLAIGLLYLMPLISGAQEVVPYAKSEVKVDWVRGTGFSKYKNYAWGTTHQMTPDPKHTIEDTIDAALQAKGLQKVGMDANPSLIVAFSGGNKLVYPIQGYLKNPVVKQGTLVVELADPHLKKAVWWGIAEDTLTDDLDKYVALIQKRVSKMFEKYPPPTRKK
jgi:hypothetical protein